MNFAAKVSKKLLRPAWQPWEIEILSRGSRGLLGFGAEDARVRITRIPTAEREPPAKMEALPPKQPKPAKPAPLPAPEKPVTASKAATPAAPRAAIPAADAANLTDQDVGAMAADLLQGMLDRMDLRAKVQVVEYRGVLDEDQDAPLVLNIEGEDLGILIGRRAETLAALQYLTRLMVNHRSHRWVNLVVVGAVGRAHGRAGSQHRTRRRAGNHAPARAPHRAYHPA